MEKFNFFYNDAAGECFLLVEASYYIYTADYGVDGSEHTCHDVRIDSVKFGKYDLLDSLPGKLVDDILGSAYDEVEQYL